MKIRVGNPIKRISKGLKKATKMVLSLPKKAWKAVGDAWKTPLGKVLLVAAAIYVTGGLLAMNAGIASGASAFAPANVAAGWGTTSLGASLGLGQGAAAAEGAAIAGAEAGVVGAGAAAPTSSALTLFPEAAAAGAEAGFGLSASAMPALGAGTGAATAAGAGAAAAPGFFTTTGGGLIGLGAMQVGGNMLAAANTPTQAEEQAEILANIQRMNNSAGVTAPNASGAMPAARFTVPNIAPNNGLLQPQQQFMPQPLPAPTQGLLQPRYT